MSITSDMRSAWAPACKPPYATVLLNGSGVIVVNARAVTAFQELNNCLKRHNYVTRKADTGALNCRDITGGSGYSLHAYGIAADINWLTNPYGPHLVTDFPPELVYDIEALTTNSGHKVFRWGGRYGGNKDAMHWEVICTPAQLATGIRTSLPPLPPAEDLPPGVMDMFIAIDNVGLFALVGNVIFTFRSVTAYGNSKNASPGVPVFTIGSDVSMQDRTDLINNLVKQHAKATQ